MWLAWAGLSALALFAAWALAVRAHAEAQGCSLFDRAATATVAWFGLVVTATWVAGAQGALTPGWTGLSAVGLSALALGAAGKRAVAAAPRQLAADLREAASLWRELARRWPPLLLLVLAAAGVWLGSLALVLLYRTWNYDATVYHAPLAHYFVQDASTARIDTFSMWILGYPYAGSLAAAWNTVFAKDTRLDDAAQLPAAVLLVSVVAAWLARLGVARAPALAFGCVVVLMPTVFLQLGHGQVDLWCAGFLSLAAYLLVFQRDRAGLLGFFFCMALYCATKLSGLLHLGLALPLFLWAAKSHRARGGAFAFDLALGAVVLLGLGAPRYVENALVAGNPIYPFALHLPLLGDFPGATEAREHFGGLPGYSGALFTAPYAIPYMLGSWFTLSPVFLPDVRAGGFGWVFPFAVIPATVAAWAVWLRRRAWAAVLPLVWLAFMALSMPTPYWGRYTLAAAMVGVISAGWGWEQLPRLKRTAAWGLCAVCLAGLGFALVQSWRHRDFYGWPAHLTEALAARYPESATVRVIDWLWPVEAALYRESLPEGAVVVYDESADYLSEYFPQKLQARVRYSSSKDPAAFAEKVVAVGARLVGVRQGSPAEGELKKRGAVFLAKAGRVGTHLYRLEPAR